MGQRSRSNLIRFGVAILVLGSAAPWAEAQNAPKLRYGFQTGREYPYDVKIVVQLGDIEETALEGVLTYNILSTTDQQIVFKQVGRLATHTKALRSQPVGPRGRGGPPRIGRPSFPIGPRGFGGPRFGPSGPEGTTIDRQGRRILSRELTHLPFLLGEQEMLMIEDLPTEGKPSWAVQGGALVEEKAPGGPPFGGPLRPSVTTSERGASERSDYRLLDRGPDVYRISKTYHLQTGPEAGVKAKFNMNGTGELQFDAKEGLFKSASMKHTIVVSAENITLTVPVTVTYRLMTPEEYAAHKVQEEKQREETKAKFDAAAAKAKAAASFAPGERAKLLKDLGSNNPALQTAAAHRLANVPADDQAGGIAKALARVVSYGANDWVKGAAVNALVVWAAPEAEAALVQASQSENHLIREPALKALGKIQADKAAAKTAGESAEPEFRKWRDATGTYEVEASLVSRQDQKVTLKKKDGTTVQVPVSKLSKEDQAYLEKQTAKPANPFE
jgi:hypothetical protein